MGDILKQFSSDLEVLGRNLANLDLQQCFLLTFQLKIVNVTQKEDIEVQLDTDATNLRKSLCVPVTCSPSHIHLTIHLHSVSSLTLSLRYLKTAPRHLFADDTLALLSSHFCPMLRALDSHIASSTYSTVITLQVSCYYTRLCIPTNVCWGKGQMNMTSRPESKREMAQEPYALSKTNSASSTTDEPIEEAK